jgi:ATP-dependent RNA helicase DeaD
MLRGARIAVEWLPVPSAAEIRSKDRQRLLASLSAPAEVDEDDRELASELLKQLSPEAIAAALIRSLRTDLPAPEDILAPSERAERGTDPGPRAGFEGASWFRLNAGRRHNADPRWLLPLICRYGHVGRADIGAIRIAAGESYLQVSERATQGFIKALRRATIAPQDEGLVIELAPEREGGSPYVAKRPHEQRPRSKKPRRPKP